MRLPTIQGIIKRRILVNYRADALIVQKILPPRFRPKLHNGSAVAGICLIRLEHIRPRFAPEFVGISSENAAHRIAVLWEDDEGKTKEGVFIPRRDTDSFINTALGGKLFPGETNEAKFEIQENGNEINFSMNSEDDKVSIKLKGEIAESLPNDSIFSSLPEASNFFEPGSLGYSVTKNEKLLDGITLQIKDWKVSAFHVRSVYSSFYDDASIFPKGSIKFDHALIMQNIAHEWHNVSSLELA